ncbi:MAG: SH3 domain-containing protein [Anaerolineae bacterium]|nr:SH3 domain-containing protein [Anaerolineae bacterium]
MQRRILTAFIILLILSIQIAGFALADTPNTWACQQPARLTIGGQGRVISWPILPNRVRSTPSLYANVVGYIPAGGTFSIIGGPQCASGILWWQVNYNGLVGWTAEGNGSTYFVEPVGTVPPPVQCYLPTRLSVYGQGHVTPGEPNVVRSAPGTSSTGANSTVIGQIPGGGVFTVMGGPQCGSDGRWWWQVNYNGLVGWTAEGEGSTYWVEPWTGPSIGCIGNPPARLTPGNYGRVNTTSYLPNRIRTSASVNASVLSYIPAGSAFHVLVGPSCSDGYTWWQVEYNGITGWTAESDAGGYFTEPY